MRRNQLCEELGDSNPSRVNSKCEGEDFGLIEMLNIGQHGWCAGWVSGLWWDAGFHHADLFQYD